MPTVGSLSEAYNVLGLLHGDSGGLQGQLDGRVIASQYLAELVLPCRARIGGVQVYADTAGTGAGTTVVDVLLNGSSIYAASGDKPTLAAVSTGAFASNAPRSRALAAGDRLAIQVLSVSTTGHARLKASVALERPKET